MSPGTYPDGTIRFTSITIILSICDKPAAVTADVSEAWAVGVPSDMNT